jgi:hypothetical protein
MSTIVRRKHTSRIELGPYRRHELLTGEIRYVQYGYTGYGDGGTDLAAFVNDGMRTDWKANRDELLDFWASHESVGLWFQNVPPWINTRGSFDVLPWASEQFDGDLEAVRRSLRDSACQYRQVYENDLHAAEGTAAYYRNLLKHPECGGLGTGSDSQSRRAKLADALAEAAHRKELLAELE